MPSKDYPSAEPFLPDKLDHDALAEAAKGCKGCPLYKDADHVVFGEGSLSAKLMFVGESPGRSEDEAGRPFVGSAGSMLDKALEEVGIARDDVYITNAVKHIKWKKTDGHKSIKTPGVREIKACRPWLEAEVELVDPACIVALGTRAARSVLGEEVKIGESREQLHATLWKPDAVVTYHPAAALRHPISEERERIREALIADIGFALKSSR